MAVASGLLSSWKPTALKQRLQLGRSSIARGRFSFGDSFVGEVPRHSVCTKTGVVASVTGR